MLPSLREHGFSVFRALVALLFSILAAALVWFTSEPLSPLLLLMFVLMTAFLVASAFDTVREHSLYTLVSALWTATLFAIWSVLESSLFAGVFAVISGVGVLVELYNYRHGTSYLRLDF